MLSVGALHYNGRGELLHQRPFGPQNLYLLSGSSLKKFTNSWPKLKSETREGFCCCCFVVVVVVLTSDFFHKYHAFVSGVFRTPCVPAVYESLQLVL